MKPIMKIPNQAIKNHLCYGVLFWGSFHKQISWLETLFTLCSDRRRATVPLPVEAVCVSSPDELLRQQLVHLAAGWRRHRPEPWQTPLESQTSAVMLHVSTSHVMSNDSTMQNIYEKNCQPKITLSENYPKKFLCLGNSHNFSWVFIFFPYKFLAAVSH